MKLTIAFLQLLPMGSLKENLEKIIPNTGNSRSVKDLIKYAPCVNDDDLLLFLPKDLRN